MKNSSSVTPLALICNAVGDELWTIVKVSEPMVIVSPTDAPVSPVPPAVLLLIVKPIPSLPLYTELKSLLNSVPVTEEVMLKVATLLEDTIEIVSKTVLSLID